MDLLVMMDVMHDNLQNGLSMFDGSEGYFYQGRRGSRNYAKFDFSKYKCQTLLLSVKLYKLIEN